jgi:hypothetical protein
MDQNFALDANSAMVPIVFICIGVLYICYLFIMFYNCVQHTSLEQCRYVDICGRVLDDARDIDTRETETNMNC